jgi:NADPH-dependent curcumin reductase CurA
MPLADQSILSKQLLENLIFSFLGEEQKAVFLAEKGFDLTMIDYSETGLQKARELAASKGVSIETICADLSDYSLELDSWDAIVIVFGHFPAVVRKKVYPQLWGALKEGGMLISETYSPKQVEYQTGGPKDPSMMVPHFQYMLKLA